MTLKLIPVCASAALLLSSAAQAVSITNRDDVDQKVTIIEGTAKTEHVLKPNTVLEGICQQGCVVRLNDKVDDDPYELEGSDVISIDGGEFWQDNVAEPEASSSGAEGQTSRPESRP